MTEDELRLFESIRDFSWDESKRDWTLQERGIDFDHARIVFEGPMVIHRSDRKGEVRYAVFGFLDDLEVAIVCTFRDNTCHVISARRARRDERKKYHSRLSRRSGESQE
jgi:uncharacterized protein